MFDKIKEVIQEQADKIKAEKQEAADKLAQEQKEQEEKEAKKLELQKMQTFYNLLKAGATFIQLIQQDLKDESNKVNRQQRRKMLKDLNKNGVLTEEIVTYYRNKVDWVLANVHYRLNPPQQPIQSSPEVQVSKEKPINEPERDIN